MEMLEILEIEKELELINFIIPKILVATFCGIFVGLEREVKQKVAGLRTIVLICVGSAIFTVSAICIPEIYNDDSDPGRTISTIVTGIGFLGGGVIVKNKDKVTGFTTAAFIWVVAAIGILCGLGVVIAPIFITLGLLLVSIFFQKLERYIRE